MRILVVTLVTIENEFEECVASINRQTYRDYRHLVFRDLPSTDANRALYGTFMERAGECDLLIRVDADMVIENENLFAWIVEKMMVWPSVEMLTIEIHDYFTDRLISGLHTYRNTVKFAVDDPFQPEFPLVSKGHTLLERSDVGYGIRHCKNPSDLQALHYGIHRGVNTRVDASPECKKNLSVFVDDPSHMEELRKTARQTVGTGGLGSGTRSSGCLYSRASESSNRAAEARAPGDRTPRWNNP